MSTPNFIGGDAFRAALGASSGDASCWGISWGGTGERKRMRGRWGIRQLAMSNMLAGLSLSSRIKETQVEFTICSLAEL